MKLEISPCAEWRYKEAVTQQVKAEFADALAMAKDKAARKILRSQIRFAIKQRLNETASSQSLW